MQSPTFPSPVHSAPALADQGLNRIWSRPSALQQTGPTTVPLYHSCSSSVISDEEKKQKAWKYEGYPEFTQWMASSNDFLVVRRFSRLGTRAMLLLQDDLTRLEEEIQAMDDYTMNLPSGSGGCGSFRLDEGSPRAAKLREAIPKLKDYWGCVEAFSSMKSRQGAQDHQVRNVQNWLHNHGNAIDPDEQAFIDHEGDTIAVVSKQKSLLRLLLERFQPMRSLFRVGGRADRVDSECTKYYSDRWFDTATTAAIIVVGLMMLFAPMWWLNGETDGYKRLGIITGFVILFSVLLFGATTSSTKGFEVLAATAAYAAVLAVFLQGGGGPMQTMDYSFVNSSISNWTGTNWTNGQLLFRNSS